MKNADQFKLHIWTALIQADLLHAPSTLDFYTSIAKDVYDLQNANITARMANGYTVHRKREAHDAMAAYFENLFITDPMAVPLMRWDACSLANWGHTLFNFAIIIQRYDLVADLKAAVELMSNHQAILTSPTLCMLWMALADTFNLRIVPRIYARGQAELFPGATEVKVALHG